MPADNRLPFTRFGDPAFPLAVLPAGGSQVFAPHCHGFHEMVFVRRGGGLQIIEDRPYTMLRGDIYLMRPDDTHAYRSDGTLGIINVLFHPHLVGESDWKRLLELPGLAAYFVRRPRAAPHKLALIPAHAREADQCCDRMMAELREKAPGWELTARGAFVDLLVLVARAHASYGSLPNHEQLGVEDPIAEALAGIHGDYHQPVSVQALAEAAGLSANWFGERFKAVTGLGVHEYVQRLRLEEARSLLEESEASLSAVAGRVGFDDPAYFSRIFKRHTGMSPRAYRTQARRAS